MATLKTQENDSSVTEFLTSVENEQRRKDSFELLELMQQVTGREPKMWGDSIVGFGKYHYKYDSGREGDWFLTGFSPRKQNLSIYIMSGSQKYDELIQRLGKCKTASSCLYVKKLSDIDRKELKELIRLSVKEVEQRYQA